MGYKQTWLVSNSLDHWFCSKTTAHFQLLPLDSSPDARCPELACSPCLGISHWSGSTGHSSYSPVQFQGWKNWFHWSSKNGFLWNNTNWLMIGLVYRIDLLKKFEPLISGEFLGNHGAGFFSASKARIQTYGLGFWMSCCVLSIVFAGNRESSQTTNLKSLYNSSNSVVG